MNREREIKLPLQGADFWTLFFQEIREPKKPTGPCFIGISQGRLEAA
jgi:hypothetical protein